jgi:hypothetical protein
MRKQLHVSFDEAQRLRNLLLLVPEALGRRERQALLAILNDVYPVKKRRSVPWFWILVGIDLCILFLLSL